MKTGHIFAAGDNESGRLGVRFQPGIYERCCQAIQTSTSDAIAVAAGLRHSLIVKSDGTVWGWGSLVNVPLPVAREPMLIPELENIVDVRSSEYHSLALRADGTVWSLRHFFNDSDFQGERLPKPCKVAISDIVAISAGNDHGLALGADGRVWEWPVPECSNSEQVSRVEGLEGVVGVAAGSSWIDRYSLVVKFDGTVWGWGSNRWRQLGDITQDRIESPRRLAGLENIVSVVAGGGGAGLALRSDGTVWSWGFNNTPEYVGLHQIPNLEGIISIAAGCCPRLYHGLAIQADGAVRAWGSGSDGQLGNGWINGVDEPSRVWGLQNVVAVAGGWYHSLAIKADGTVWAWGSDSWGQLGQPGNNVMSHLSLPMPVLDRITQISTGLDHSLAVDDAGMVWAWADARDLKRRHENLEPDQVFIQVKGLPAIRSVSTYRDHNLALSVDGMVWAWGRNCDGELGIGHESQQEQPIQVIGLHNVKLIAAGDEHSLALTHEGIVWAWGSNSIGKLGDGTTTDRNSPVRVRKPGDAIWITATGDRSFVVTSDGTVWQLNTNPIQIAIMPGISRIAVGENHFVATTRDGNVWVWGSNEYGQLGIGNVPERRYIPVRLDAPKDVVAIATGAHHSIAVRSDGIAWAWGRNDCGQLGDGTVINRNVPVRVHDIHGVIDTAACGKHSLYLAK